MNITEIRVKLVSNDAERLKAFCSITLDEDFVIRDLKVIDGANGVFVAMPSRKLCDRCPRCGSKNHLRSRHCNECGAPLAEGRAPRDDMGRAKLHADIAHPINAACREKLQKAVVEAYQAEVEKSRQPGYRPPAYDEEDVEADYDSDKAEQTRATRPSTPEPKERSADQEDEFDSLIAGLNRDAKARREERRRKQKVQEPQEASQDSAPPPAEQRPEPAKATTGSGGSALDDFLSKLGTSGGPSVSPHRRKSGRRGSGGPPREERPADRPPEPAKPTPEPAPAAPAQPQVREPVDEGEEDDFGAGIL